MPVKKPATGCLLMALSLLTCVTTAKAERQVLQDATIIWREDGVKFGGFSGLEISSQGERLTAVSDRGNWITAELLRENGRLTGAKMTDFGPLLAISGNRVAGNDADAEGLALGPTGEYFVSYEGFHRVRRHALLQGPATNIPSPPAFAHLQNNSALEALAVDAAGTLYAIPERSGALDRPFTVFRYRNGTWDTQLLLRRDGNFLVVGADIGPDGRIYVLERDFNMLGFFATRVRSFVIGESRLQGERTEVLTRMGELDNMEGISVWSDSAGQSRITLISDDNFRFLQRTMLVEYVIRPE